MGIFLGFVNEKVMGYGLRVMGYWLQVAKDGFDSSKTV